MKCTDEKMHTKSSPTNRRKKKLTKTEDRRTKQKEKEITDKDRRIQLLQVYLRAEKLKAGYPVVEEAGCQR